MTHIPQVDASVAEYMSEAVIRFIDGLGIIVAATIVAEREACAKVCEAADKGTTAEDLAAMIRRRGSTLLGGRVVAVDYGT